MITLNVNHTVDSAVPDDGTVEAPEMLSKPTFEVDLIKPWARLSPSHAAMFKRKNTQRARKLRTKMYLQLTRSQCSRATTTLTPATRWPVTSWTATSTISS